MPSRYVLVARPRPSLWFLLSAIPLALVLEGALAWTSLASGFEIERDLILDLELDSLLSLLLPLVPPLVLSLLIPLVLKREPAPSQA